MYVCCFLYCNLLQLDLVEGYLLPFFYIHASVIFNRVRRVRVRNVYFDNEKHDIEETNTETFMCRSMSATIAYIELHMIKK